MKTSICVLIFAMVFLVGCSSSSIFQVIEIESTNCTKNQDFLVSENDTIRVVYIFWAEKGTMGLFIHNKLDRPLYIDWKKCSFIQGITKNDYYSESTKMSTTGTSYGMEYWQNFWSANSSSSQFMQTTFGYSMVQVTVNERVTFIPPGTTIKRAEFGIATGPLIAWPSDKVVKRDSILYVEPSEAIQNQGLPKDFDAAKATLLSVSFSPDTSPIDFRSFISYSTDEKFSTEQYVHSRFYVSRILQGPQDFFKARKFRRVENWDPSSNMWASPSRFYVLSKTGYNPSKK